VPRHGSLSWRRDPAIQARMATVERLHLRGDTNMTIAAALEVDEKTVRNDLTRLQELWLERTQAKQEVMRAEAVARLEDVRKRAIAAAEFDERNETAVLYGVAVEIEGETRYVHLDEKGRAEYRGQKAQDLNVARQAAMDQAKVLGLIVEKQEHSGEVGVRQLIGVNIDDI
jgi:hypothetical protein